MWWWWRDTKEKRKCLKYVVIRPKKGAVSLKRKVKRLLVKKRIKDYKDKYIKKVWHKGWIVDKKERELLDGWKCVGNEIKKREKEGPVDVCTKISKNGEWMGQ